MTGQLDTLDRLRNDAALWRPIKIFQLDTTGRKCKARPEYDRAKHKTLYCTLPVFTSFKASAP
jgi:hypothetical protein